MENNKTERWYWCQHCVAFRPVHLDDCNILYCDYGHEINLGLSIRLIDWDMSHQGRQDGHI